MKYRRIAVSGPHFISKERKIFVLIRINKIRRNLMNKINKQ
jgi:hypothetical protein